ncbi:uncharacterized protein STAUR_7721 [Stigmatella aurantiaca DW4/3-1]|uniref:Uncharacterized protein n=1 Tax=Stigmatella aurantiaca (strain DW4/3-1) TaxID=378806 RepID=E3FKA7_STIAD|nr:uncharacterized protein STAUR_7721 [Stigmatella aurantiaca DW4/3-1]
MEEVTAQAAGPAKQAQQGFSLGDLFEHKPGQRERALNVTMEAPPGSVGAAINSPLAIATLAVGGVCAGNAGDFYESQRPLLNSPATPENIDTFARLETANFAAQEDCSRNVGGLLSAQDRAAIIQKSAEINQHQGDWIRQTINFVADPFRSIFKF